MLVGRERKPLRDRKYRNGPNHLGLKRSRIRKLERITGEKGYTITEKQTNKQTPRPEDKRWGEKHRQSKRCTARKQSCVEVELWVGCWEGERRGADGKEAEGDGVALRSSAWSRHMVFPSCLAWANRGLFLITLHGPSCPCFSAVTCYPKTPQMTHEGEPKEVLSLLPVEGEGNYDLNSWINRKKCPPFSHLAILFFIFTYIHMELCRFSVLFFPKLWERLRRKVSWTEWGEHPCMENIGKQDVPKVGWSPKAQVPGWLY